MKPLQSVAMGFVVLLLYAPLGGVDLLFDPLGWLLVVLGVRGLPAGFPHRRNLFGLGVLAALVSVPLSVPAVLDALDDADESLAWAANLPQFGWYLLLAVALTQAGTEAADKGAETWWRTIALGCVAVIVLPVLVFGGGIDGLADTAGAAVALVPIAMIVMLFVHAGRAWADGPSVPAAD